jgi:hypothetical protein
MRPYCRRIFVCLQSPQQEKHMSLTQTIVSLPDELKLAIAAGILFLVRLVLDGRVPDKYISEIAAAISTALITVIGVLLGMIPPEFEALANSILSLIVVLLGMVFAVNAYRMVRHNLHARGLKA